MHGTFRRSSAGGRNKQHGFTLVELLIVIAVIAVVSVVVVVVIDPVELLRRSRDSNRLSDMATITSAINFFITQNNSPLGAASTTYISVPDPLATSTAGDQCQGIGVLAGPNYQCAENATYQKPDATGWMPINFFSLTTGSPLAKLPVDPINQTSSNLYYAYNVSGSQYEITAVLESKKYTAQFAATPQDPSFPQLLVNGTNFNLSQLYNLSALVGYWNFDEGTGNTARDMSGFGRNLGAVYPPGAWTAGKFGSAIQTTGDTDGLWRYFPGQFPTYVPITMLAWVNAAASNQVKYIAEFGNGSYNYTRIAQNGTKVEGVLTSGTSVPTCGTLDAPAGSVSAGNWQLVGLTYDGTTETFYNNGAIAASQNVSCALYPPTNLYVAWQSTCGVNCSFNGAVDDLRIFNRALSPAEMAALYYAGRNP